MVGRITRPHGVGGQVRVKIHSDWPDRFYHLEQVFVGLGTPSERSAPDEEQDQLMRVERVRLNQGFAILKLGGCDSRDQAEALRGHYLQIPIEEAIPLADGEFFLYQLIGLRVVTHEGEKLGELTEILETGANDVFVIRGTEGELLIPDLPEVIREIDLESGLMLVQLPAGLRDG
ncbi:MAG: 16S rRNA processing protein RimM [Ardenticatenales bacterium]|nr:16S rRNA processing protein RimM [Ardenticatenales bacterium]